MPIRSIADLRGAVGKDWNDVSDEDLIKSYADSIKLDPVNVARELGYDVGTGGMAAKRLTSSVSNYVGGLQGVGEEIAGGLGLSGAQNYLAEKRRANELQAQVASSRARDMGAVESYKEVDTVGKGLNYLGGLVVQSFPYAIEAATGGLEARALMGGTRAALSEARAALVAAEAAKDTTEVVRATQAVKQAERSLDIGSGVGVAAQSYPSAVGDILQNQREQTGGKTDLGSAALYGAGYTGLNVMGVGGALGRGTLFRNTIDFLDRPGGITGGLARAGATAVGTGVKEGLSETGQEMFNQAGRMAVDDKAQFFDQEAQERYKESFVGGFALGGAMGGALGGYRRSEGYQAGNDVQQAFTQPQTSGTPITGQTPPAPPGTTVTAPPAPPNMPPGQTGAPITPPSAPAVVGGTTAVAQASQQQTQADFAAQQQQQIQDQREVIINQFGLRGENPSVGQFFNRPILSVDAINKVADALGPIAAKLDQQEATVMDAIVQADKATGGKLVNFKFNADKIPQSVQKGVEAVLSVATKFQIGHVGSAEEAAQNLNTLSKSAKGAELEQINAIHQVLTGKDTEGYVTAQAPKPTKGKSNARQQQQLPEQVPTGLGTVSEQGGTVQGDGGLTGLLQPGAVQPIGTGSDVGTAISQQAGQPSGEGIRPSAGIAADNGSVVLTPQVTGVPSETTQTGTAAPTSTDVTGQPGVSAVDSGTNGVQAGAEQYNPRLQYYATDLSHISSERRDAIRDAILKRAITGAKDTDEKENAKNRITFEERLLAVEAILLTGQTRVEIEKTINALRVKANRPTLADGSLGKSLLRLGISETPALSPAQKEAKASLETDLGISPEVAAEIDALPKTAKRKLDEKAQFKNTNGQLVTEITTHPRREARMKAANPTLPADVVAKSIDRLEKLEAAVSTEFSALPFSTSLLDIALNATEFAEFPNGISEQDFGYLYKRTKRKVLTRKTIEDEQSSNDQDFDKTVPLAEEIFGINEDKDSIKAGFIESAGGSQGAVEGQAQKELNDIEAKVKALDVAIENATTKEEKTTLQGLRNAEFDKYKNRQKKWAKNTFTPLKESTKRTTAAAKIKNEQEQDTLDADWVDAEEAWNEFSAEYDGPAFDELSESDQFKFVGAGESNWTSTFVGKFVEKLKEQEQEDAVQVESADEGDVQEPAGGGEKVGKANAKPKKPARARKAKAESKPAEETKPEIKTAEEQWTALADQFPQMPPYATLNKDEKIRWDDVAERGVANLAAANAILSTVVKAAPAEKVETPAAVGTTEAVEQPKFGVARAVKNPYTAAELMADIKNFIRADILGNKLIIVDSVSDLIRHPDADLRAVGKAVGDKGAYGVAANGKAYLIANRIEQGQGRAKFMHEVGAHLGLENLLPKMVYDKLASQIDTWAKADNGSVESKLAKAAQARVEAANTPAEDRQSEMLAYFIEEAVQSGIDPTAAGKESAALQSWFRTLWAAFKVAIRRLGFKTETLTAQDIVNLAFGAARLEITGTWHGTAADFRKFSHAFMSSGEGAQAFGWGTYLAQKVGIAKGYWTDDIKRKTKIEQRGSFKGEDFKSIQARLTAKLKSKEKLTDDETALRTVMYEIEGAALSGFGDPISEAYKNLAKVKTGLDSWRASQYKRALNFYENNKKLFEYEETEITPAGSLMRVDTSVSDSEMIDWDAPIANQPPIVKEFLADFLTEEITAPTNQIKTGGDIYKYLLAKFYRGAGNTGKWDYAEKQTKLEIKKAVSQYLDAHGIKGHKFLDQPSRNVNNDPTLTFDGKVYTSSELRTIYKAGEDNLAAAKYILLRHILRNGVASVRAELEQKVAKITAMYEQIRDESAARYNVKVDQVKERERIKQDVSKTYEGQQLAWLDANESKIVVNETPRTRNVVIYNDRNIFRVGSETAADKQRMKFGFVGLKGLAQRGMTPKEEGRFLNAKLMDATGELRSDIWYDTGWLRGADGQWRTEISDKDAKLKASLPNFGTGKLGDLLDHSTLYKLYPQLTGYTLVVDPQMEPNSAAFIPEQQEIRMAAVQNSPVTALLHEVQHAIQEIEGFGKGANPAEMDMFNVNAANKFAAASHVFGYVSPETQEAIAKYRDAIEAKHLAVVARDTGDFKTVAEERAAVQRTMDTDKAARRALGEMLSVLGSTEGEFKERLYRMVSGEIEARDVEARRQYSDALRRQVVPGEAEGFTPETQLVYDKASNSYMKFGVNGKTADQHAREQISKLPPKWQPAARTVTTTLMHTLKKAGLASMITEDVIGAATKYMKSAQNYLTAQYARQATRLAHELKIEKILQQHDKLPENLKGTGKGSVNEYIHDSTREGLWGYYPDARMVGTTMAKIDPGFKARFDAFPAAAQKLIKDVFEQGHDSLVAKQKAVTDAINREYADRASDVLGDADLTAELNKEKNLRIARESKLMGLDGSKPYAYMGRYGDYVVVGKSAEYKHHEEQAKAGPMVKGEYVYGSESQKWLEDNRSNPAHYVVQFAETLDEADQIAEQLNATGNYDIAESFEKEPYSQEGGEMFAAVARLRNLYDRESDGDNPAAAKAIRNLLGDLYLHTVSEASARKSEFQRLNISGSDKDMMRNLATRGRADAHFLAALQHNDAISDAITGMREERNRNRREATPYFNELLKRHANSMKYETPGVLSSALLRMSTVWYLSTNPAFYLQQILQTGTLSLPYMAGRLGYFRSARAIKLAYSDMATLVKGLGVSDHVDFEKAPADVRAMLNTLVGMGKIDIGIDSDSAARAGDTGVIAAVMQKLQGVNNRIETINRATAAIAAYRGYLDRYKNNDTAAATKYAAEVVSNTHGSYDAFNTPRIMSTGAGKVLLQFKRFQIIQISMLAKLLTTAFKGASAEEKTVARHSLAFIAGQMGVLGGIMAVPFAQQAASILAGILGEPDEPDNWEFKLRRMIGDKAVSDLLINGVPGALGVDLSSKIGLGNVFSVLPFTDIDFTSRAGAEKVIVGLMGPTASLGLKFIDGLGMMTQGDYYKGLEQMLPNGVANVLKSGRFATEGITMRNGDVVLKPEEISMLDAAFQAVGLPTNTITDRQFTQKVVKEFDKYYKQRDTEIKGDYVEASRNGDSASMGDAIDEWNKLQASRVANGYKRQPFSDLYKAPMAAIKRERNVSGGVEFTKTNRQLVESLSTI